MLGPGENPPPAADSGSDESSGSAHTAINYARLSSICPWAYAGKNHFSPVASNSFSRCISTDGSTGKGLAVVLCCACLRVRARVSIVLCMSKGGGHGFNVGALF